MGKFVGFGVRGSNIYQPSQVQLSTPKQVTPYLLAGGLDDAAGGAVYDKAGTGAVDFIGSGPGDAVFTDTGSGGVVLVASGPGDAIFTDTGAGIVGLAAAGPGDAVFINTGAGIAGLAAAGPGDTVFVETGSGTVVFTGGAVDARDVPKTGGGTLGLAGSGASQYTPVGLGLTGGGPALVPDEGRFIVKTGRARLHLAVSGTALVEIDEWARLVGRRREQIRTLELVGAL